MIWLNVTALVLCGAGFLAEAVMGEWKWHEAPLTGFLAALNGLALLTY